MRGEGNGCGWAEKWQEERAEGAQESAQALGDPATAAAPFWSASRGFAQIDFEVLDGGDEQILDLLPPEAAPARTFEAVLDGGLTKVAFLEPLPPLSIAPRSRSVGLAPGSIQ